MSTTPDALVETTVATLETTLAATETVVTEATVAAEEMLDIESIKALLDGFDPATLLPDLSKVFDSLVPICRIAVLIGPVVVLLLGLSYLILTPKEANYYLGYRCYFGMGSEYAWRFTQRLAGFVWMIAGGLLTLVMFFVTVAVGGKDLAQMGYDAVICLFWELGVIVVACLVIDVVVLLRYDRKGNVRPNTVIRVGERFLGMEMPREAYPQEEYPQEEYPYEEGQPQM